MPRISPFFGIVIEMYFGDHPPPHFHARYSGESRASFSDGAIKEIDLSKLIAKGSVFAPIRDRRDVFDQVHVNPETRTLSGRGKSILIQRCSTAISSRHPEHASTDDSGTRARNRLIAPAVSLPSSGP